MLDLLKTELEYAKQTHNWQGLTNKQKFEILESELNELARALLTDDKRQVKQEALHIACVAMRIVLECGKYGNKS